MEASFLSSRESSWVPKPDSRVSSGGIHGWSFNFPRRTLQCGKNLHEITIPWLLQNLHNDYENCTQLVLESHNRRSSKFLFCFFPLVRIEYLCRKAWFMPIREILRKPLPHFFETQAEISSLAADGRDEAQAYQTPLHVLPDISALFLSAVRNMPMFNIRIQYLMCTQ